MHYALSQAVQAAFAHSMLAALQHKAGFMLAMRHCSLALTCSGMLLRIALAFLGAAHFTLPPPWSPSSCCSAPSC